jgi:hypothetical protein
MINKIKVPVCDNCGLVGGGMGIESVCRECGKPMSYVEFTRQPTTSAVDLLDAPACCASFVFDGTHHKDCRFAQPANH